MVPMLGSLCLVILCVFVVTNLAGVRHSTKNNEDDIQATSIIPITEHILEMGYPVESHEFMTEDGYFLTYHRIPYGRVRTLNHHRPPVMVHHGLLCVSPVWAEVNDSLGFLLADAGYDVWLANSRGTEFARKHIWYDPDKDKKFFWDWSWHEMGYYDLPAAIDYILNVTGSEQLSYIGHSLGTTMYFVLASTRPEYMNKINAGVMMAPVAYIKDMPSPSFRFLHDFETPLDWLAKLFGVYEILRYSDFWYRVLHLFCREGAITQPLCLEIIFSLTGHDPEQTSKSLLTTYLNYLPGGVSIKTLVHLSQIVNSNFKYYDYGLIGNLKRYHSVFPPSYDLAKVIAPTYFYLASNDWIVTPDVVVHTAQKVGNLQGLTLVDDADFNHMDFMWAIDIKSLVYDDVIRTLNTVHNK